MKRLYLHIGSEKTGTTTLQMFLARNERILNNEGYTYFGNIESIYYTEYSHRPIVACFSPSLPDYVPSKKYHPKSDLLTKLKDDLKFEEKNVILSAEHFSSRLRSTEDMKDLRETLSSHVIRVVYYIRPQYDFYPSVYSMGIRCGRRQKYSPDEPDPRSYYYNYMELITPWAENFGEENIIVRDFNKLKGQDIRTDFLSLLKIKKSPEFVFDADQNMSLDTKQAEALRLINHCLPVFEETSSDTFHQYSDIRGLVTNFLPRGKHIRNILNNEERRAISERFLESNKVLEQKFMNPGALSSWETLSFDQTDESFDESITTLEMAETLVKVVDHLLHLERKNSDSLTELQTLHLERKNSDSLTELQTQLNRIMNSRSWRLTRYLRILNGFLKRTR